MPCTTTPWVSFTGAFSVTWQNVAMGTALASLTEEKETFTTTDLVAHYFLPVREGILTGQARVIRRGKTAAYVECEVIDQEQRLVGKFSSTCAIRSA